MKTLSARAKAFIVAAFLSFLVYGIFQGLYGAQASVMMDYFNTTSAQHGMIITVQGIGGLAVAIICSFIGDKFNKLNLCLLGIFLMTVGSIATFFAEGYMFLFIMSLAAGIGYTFIDIMNGAVFAEVFINNKKTLIPMLHIFFGAGAMISPFFASLMVDADNPASYGLTFLIIGLASAAVLVTYFWTSKLILPETPYKKKAEVKQSAPAKAGEIFKYKTTIVLLIAGALYYSFQKGVQSWLAAYIQQTGASFELSANVLTMFFVGSLAMRIVSPWLFNKFDIKRMCIVFMLISAGFMVAALLCTNMALIITFVILSGAFQGVFSAAFAYIACDIFRTKTGSANSVVLIAISIGSMSAPLWMGAMADVMGFMVPLYIICGMLCLSTLFIWLSYKVAAKEGAC